MNISNMATMFKAYNTELLRRIKEMEEIFNTMAKEAKESGDKYYFFFEKGNILGRIHEADGFGIVDGDFCKIEYFFDDTSTEEFDEDLSWLLDNDYKEVGINKMKKYHKNRSEYSKALMGGK